MNYRHAFHAGNFADVFKHALLSRILVYLGRKPAPFRYIDTHAGLGRYDLAGDEATRTGEWRAGIGRLCAAVHPPAIEALLRPYLDAVGSLTDDGRPLDYPGSPALAQSLLRDGDRLLLAELHPDDAATLRVAMGRDKRVKILMRDGYEVLNAAIPAPERRGVVLIDPPFEVPDEFNRLAAALAGACRKWATGTYAVWYPIKEAAPLAAFYDRLDGLNLPPACRLELARETPAPGAALRGCGLLVINPPYLLADEARQLLPYLAQVLGQADAPPFRPLIAEMPAR